MSVLLFEINEGVGKITLNRPDAFNSVTRELALAFQDTLDTCANREDIRSVLITGSGRAFCAGQDLKEITDENRPGFRVILDEHFKPIILKIRELEKPVIAAVNGVAAGAGANIALACDIVLASEKASFIQAFSAIGLVPDSGGTFFLPRLIGFQKALAISMLGDKISASEAERIGMIYKVLPAEEFMSESLTLAQRMAKMATKGLALTKKAFNQSLNNNLEAQLTMETATQLAAFETHDYNEGVQAFVEKRKAEFKGK